jgi:hypothetical protein
MRSSGSLCVIQTVDVDFFSIYESTIFGTPVRPRALRNDVPVHARPLTSWNGRVEISLPAAATLMMTLALQPR